MSFGGDTAYKKTVGKFDVEMQFGGFPHWTTIKFRKWDSDASVVDELSGIHHEDIPDLIYALQRAMDKANSRMKK